MPARARQLSVVASQPRTKLQEAGHAWLAHLRAEGRSVKTLYDRERNLFAVVFPHLAELGVSEPAQITSRVLDQLAVALSEGGRTPATVGTYMRDVKSFLRWLTAEGDLEKTPAIPKVSQPLRHPEVLTESEYKPLVAVADRQHPRDVLIVRVMGEAGLRASEVTALREEDLLELTAPDGRQFAGRHVGTLRAEHGDRMKVNRRREKRRRWTSPSGQTIGTSTSAG
jgi:site-specific recombinase XerC